jgi:hypothetical protein
MRIAFSDLLASVPVALRSRTPDFAYGQNRQPTDVKATSGKPATP